MELSAHIFLIKLDAVFRVAGLCWVEAARIAGSPLTVRRMVADPYSGPHRRQDRTRYRGETGIHPLP